MKKILDSIWFTDFSTGTGSIGLILVLDEEGKKRLYIGAVLPMPMSEELDAQHIINNGTQLKPDHPFWNLVALAKPQSKE